MYPDVQLFIAGEWQPAAAGETLPVIDPHNEEQIGTVACARRADLDRALESAQQGFQRWKRTGAFERYQCLRRAADLFRQRADLVADLMSREQGKPLAEAKMEVLAGADIIDWFAEEGRRAYGRVIPARTAGVTQMAVREPVGPVAAFTPWNFPINQVVRKLSAAVATGCSIIVKGPEETPASPAELIRAFADAGVPPGVVNLVYGSPGEISEYLIAHPVIRKISFTGSTPVGKHLAELAGRYMKRATMELGGHAPALVFEDADLDIAAKVLAANKYRNAGQVCVCPTRLLIQESVFDPFVERFLGHVKGIKLGRGLDADVTMGPLVHERRLEAMAQLVADAVEKGAKLLLGGERVGTKGYFFMPTVLADVPTSARIMNEEPFGPVAIINRFKKFDDAMAEANRLPYGLASYAYTRSVKTATDIAASLEAGMLSINHHGLAFPETPFGGVKDSGYGSEGGSEGIEGYLVTKFVTQAAN